MYPWRPTQVGWATWTRWQDRSAWPQWPPCLRQGCPPWVPSRLMILLWGEATFSQTSCLEWIWLSRRETHHGNTADTEDSWLLLSSADWAHLLKTLTSLESCVYLFWPNRPASQFCQSQVSRWAWAPAPRVESTWLLQEELPLLLTVWSSRPDSCSVCSLHSP